MILKVLFDAQAASDATQAGTEMGSMIGTIGMLVVFFIAFYFILIRPQRKRDKELKEQISAMSVGDKIVTIGGIVGVLARVDEDSVTIYTSMANTPITFQKSAISTVVPRNGEKKTADKKVSDKKKEKKAKKEEEATED